MIGIAYYIFNDFEEKGALKGALVEVVRAAGGQRQLETVLANLPPMSEMCQRTSLP
jgi:hypothetical protein